MRLKKGQDRVQLLHLRPEDFDKARYATRNADGTPMQGRPIYFCVDANYGALVFPAADKKYIVSFGIVPLAQIV